MQLVVGELILFKKSELLGLSEQRKIKVIRMFWRMGNFENLGKTEKN